MTRQEYMQQLAALLAAMPEAERRDALDYYEEYFDAAGPEKEAQTIQELGSPQNVAEKIWEGTGAQFGTPMPDNSMPEQGSRRRKSPVWIVLAILAILIVVLLWSREAPPCHITMVGSHHPLREPDLHLSMYPALLSFGQQLLTGCGLQHGIFCTQPAFYAVLQSLQPPMPACP